MHYLADSFSTPQKGFTNPEEKTENSTFQKDKAVKSAASIEDTYILIETSLKNQQIAQAKELAKDNVVLSTIVKDTLFEREMQKIFSNQWQLNDLGRFQERSNDLSQRQKDILEKVIMLKSRRSLNNCLVNTISYLLRDLIVGKDIEERNIENSIVYNKLKGPLVELQKRLGNYSSRNNTEQEIIISQLPAPSFQERISTIQNELFLKQKNIKDLKRQLSCALTKNNELKAIIIANQDTNINRYIRDIQKLNNLILRNYIPKKIDIQIRSSLNQIKDSISLLHKHQSIDTEQRNNIKSKLMRVQLLINKKIITYTQTKCEEQNAFLQLTQRIDKQYAKKDEQIAQLKQIIEEQAVEIDSLKLEIQQSPISDSQAKLKQLEATLKEKYERLAELQQEKESENMTKGLQLKQLKAKIAEMQVQLQKKEDQVANSVEKQLQLYQLVKQQMEELKVQHFRQKQQFRVEKERLELQISSLQLLTSKLNLSYSKQQIIDHNLQQSLNYSLINERYEPTVTPRIQYSKVTAITNTTKDKEQTEIKLSKLNEQYEELLTQNIALHNQTDELKEKVMESKRLAENQKKQLRQIEEKFNNVEKKLKVIMATQEFNRQYGNQSLSNLFTGDILEQSPSDKIYLKKLLEQRYKRPIFKSSLLYRWDPFNNTNFHKYIDHKEGIFALIKLPNNRVVAGYYEGKLVPKTVLDKDALLISVTNKEIFELNIPNRRGATYDQFFFILGNSEMRIKSGQKKLFSNFGLNNGYFRSRGHKVNTIMGSKDRELQFEDLQFYQIIYF